MTSYQKNDNGGSYQPIEGSGSNKGGSKKWVYGAVVVVIVGIVAYFAVGSKPGASTAAAVAKADLPKTKSGNLKLFDENSK